MANPFKTNKMKRIGIDNNNTNLTIGVIFFIIIFGIAMIALLSSCTSTQKIYERELVTELIDTEKYYGEIKYMTWSSWQKKYAGEHECLKITTIYCQAFEGDNHPLIIKICGWDKENIKVGEKVWVYNTLPMNYHDHNKFVIIGDYKYKMLE